MRGQLPYGHQAPSSTRPKIGRKSVDSVENPGAKHDIPVDNPFGLVVDYWRVLLESAAPELGALRSSHIEKSLVNGLISNDMPIPCVESDTGYPQSCQPFS